MGRADVSNCVKLYTTADEIGANTLRDHCSTLISTHWVSNNWVIPTKILLNEPA